MSNTNSTDTSKTRATPQQTPFAKKVETNDAQPAKVEAPKPSTEGHRQPTGQQKQTIVENAPGTSRR